MHAAQSVRKWRMDAVLCKLCAHVLCDARAAELWRVLWHIQVARRGSGGGGEGSSGCGGAASAAMAAAMAAAKAFGVVAEVAGLV